MIPHNLVPDDDNPGYAAMSSSLPDQGQDDPAGTPPVAWWDAASPAGGDVVLSGAVLLFMAVAFAFVLHHYFAVRRRGGAGVPSSSSSGGGQRVRGASAVGPSSVDAAAADNAGGGISPAVLRALPLTVYRARKEEEEALECARAVCLAELADGEAARFLPRCGHGFHAECVDLWLRGHATCPLCRVDVVCKATAGALPQALPPEPANYPRNLPTNVLFWGWGSQQHAVTTAARTTGASSSSGAPPAALVIEVRDRETAAAPTPPRAAKPQGLARLSSLRRLWSRGGRHQDTGATSSRSCQRATSGEGTEQAPPSPLDIWNVT